MGNKKAFQSNSERLCGLEAERIELSCSIASPQMTTCLAQVVILRFIFAGGT